jgi:hypothetical protein
MKRCEQWPSLLAQFIEERRSMPFAWSTNDCCIFAADWLRLCTGQDFAHDMRGRYTSGLGAFRLLRRYGGVLGLVRNHAKLAEVNRRMMKRGDIVACEARTGLALGVSLGDKVAFVSSGGLVFPNPSLVTHSWTF